jgi:hypothetical protein
MVIIKLRGGTGNQIIQILAGFELANYRNCPLKVDLGYYKNGLKKQIDDCGRLPIVNLLEVLQIEVIYTHKLKLKFLEILDTIKGNKEYKKTIYYEDILKDSFNLFLTKKYKQWISSYFDFSFGIMFRNTLSNSLKALYSGNSRVSGTLASLKKLQEDFSLVGVHIRRGDYLKHQNLYVNLLDDTDYYQKAFDLVTNKLNNIKFLIFSDDPLILNNLAAKKDLVKYKNNLIFAGDFFLEENNIDDLSELFVLACMDVVIMANSTFSGCSAILHGHVAKNPQFVCFPSLWYNSMAWQKKHNSQKQYFDSVSYAIDNIYLGET